MSPEMRDEPIKEVADDMEQDAERLESKNSELEEDIDEAKDASELTAEQADPDNAAKDVGGDWKDEARNDAEPSAADEQDDPSDDETDDDDASDEDASEDDASDEDDR